MTRNQFWNLKLVLEFYLVKYFCCTFVPLCFFKFHVKKITSGVYLKREISILSHLCSARNSKLFPFITGCFTVNVAGHSPRPRPPKGGSSSQVKAEVLHQENTYKKLALLFVFFFFWFKRKKILLWSVKTFINTTFKRSLLVHCITWKNVQRSLIPLFPPLSKARSWQLSSLVLKQCFPLKLLNGI